MLLYHGTSEARWNDIVAKGAIIPRGKTKLGNWKHTIESNPKCVYMTDAYAGYFAINAIEVPKDDSEVRAAIIEIDTDRLDAFNLVPDEDAIEQGERGARSIAKKEMLRRTREIPKNLNSAHRYGA